MSQPFARLPPPPYSAVIFSSQGNRQDDAGYGEAADRMLQLAQAQPGFLGAESRRGADGSGITVPCRDREDAIAAWRSDTGHAGARRHGRDRWYDHFERRVATVERTYGRRTATSHE